MHVCDARVKLVLLAAYSVTLFFVRTWTGIALCAGAFVVLLAVSRLPLRSIFGLLVPVYVIVMFTVLFNGFSFNALDAASSVPGGLGDVSAGVFASFDPVIFFGSFGFVPTGFARGCFYGLRIILLVAGSFVVSLTTTSTDLTAALDDFLKPLRILRIPTDDISMVFSLALRFIPVTAEEFSRVHDAQWARGAAFGSGGLWKRLCAWQTVLIPLFVGLFRRADALAVGMDARCYGSGVNRTSLADRRFPAKAAFVLVVGLAACGALSAFL